MRYLPLESHHIANLRLHSIAAGIWFPLAQRPSQSSCVCLVSTGGGSSVARSAMLLRVLRMTRLLRLLRIYRLKQALSDENEGGYVRPFARTEEPSISTV